jgi:hypothetical protein
MGNKYMKFECIKGMSDTDNINVVVMMGDVVQFIENEEGMIYVEGIVGWCKGLELNFTPQQFVDHFMFVM